MKQSSTQKFASLSFVLVMSLAFHGFAEAQLITIQDPSMPAANTAQNSQVSPQLQNQDADSEDAQLDADEVQTVMPTQQGRPVTISTQPAQTQYSTQPVSIAPGTQPVQSASVPSAQGLNVAGASTGIGGANPGNANTGGVQVQHVTVTATQDQAAANSSDLLKKFRQMKENETNQVALDKIEESRMENELNLRGRVNDAFSSRPATQNLDQQNMMMAPQMMQQPMVQPSVVPVVPMGQEIETEENVEVKKGASHKDKKFSIQPMGGYRWVLDNTAEYEVQNMGIGGVGLEGRLTKNISIEGSALYGRDEFYFQGGGYYAGYVAPAYTNGYYGNYYGNSYYDPRYAPRSRDSFEVSGALKLGADVGAVRPYVLGGIGGMLQKYNIDDSYTTEQLKQIGWARNTTNFVGNFGAGIDMNANSALSLGARFDYQTFLSNEYTEMQRIFGDLTDRYRLIASVQMQF